MRRPGLTPYAFAVSIIDKTKTLTHGLGKTRSGSPSIGIQALIEKSRQKGFADRIKKAVSDDEALDAAKLLSNKGRARRYAEGAGIAATVNPVMRMVGKGVEAAANARGGGRAGMARAAIKGITRGELSRHVVEGALAGGGVQAIREGVELGKARKTVKNFVAERTQPKTAMPAAEYWKTPAGKKFKAQEREALKRLDGTED